MTKVITNYVSDIDKVLQNFDELHPTPSESQQAEITKHAKIAKKRDNPEIKDQESIWGEF